MGRPVIDLTLAKAHLRVEHDLDDELIGLFVEAAIDRTLQEIGLAGVLEREHKTETTHAAFGFLYPVEEIVAVEKRDGFGVWRELPAAEWELGGSVDERQVLRLSEAAGHRSGSEYRVEWRAGFKVLPAWFRVACYFLLGHYYENRSSIVIGAGLAAVELPQGFHHLCGPHKRWFFA
ncbi:phage gp6-like head-tail connector protein [Luteolibacter sp. GHJ8]|uniref:Phage gp6-like head-tail connector protein n=1 Tax=Luteolibacter rhizosphaerae TaxID=2989719 RepID=A0ABT3GAC6_9BACT|nr:head-tail connector protein [Luteolibacter rhizosphaerae]MCW1916789.1 phage gp6-like head-tail connector protein [Luteolibacter rhizosphaerae]